MFPARPPRGQRRQRLGHRRQANKEGTKGHQVFKFSPDGKVLMTLGKAGVAGDGPDTFNEPTDVVVAPNGDIFVADGHGGSDSATRRIVKFTKDGKFIKEWGKLGSAPGEFRTPARAWRSTRRAACSSPTAATTASRSSIRTASSSTEWKQFGRVSGLFIDRNDTLYAIDSESNADTASGLEDRHPDREREGRQGARLHPAARDRTSPQGAAGEGVAVDRDGNVYAAEGPISRRPRPAAA